jgi:hypothetical protein
MAGRMRASFSEFLVKGRVIPVAGKICRHHVGARAGLFSLFEQVGKSFFHEGLDLTAFGGGEGSAGSQQMGVGFSPGGLFGGRMRNQPGNGSKVME